MHAPIKHSKVFQKDNLILIHKMMSSVEEKILDYDVFCSRLCCNYCKNPPLNSLTDFQLSK